MNLKINEIYYSIQGESSFSGLPCIFIRLTYCNLRCSYCDSEYTFHNGEKIDIKDIINQIKQYPCKLVQVTGGEPLFQKNCINLLKTLVEEQYNVLLETSGSLSIEKVPKEVINIIDFKCPSSKMQKKNLWENLDYIKTNDQIKFVIGNKEDYEWTKDKIYKYNLDKKCEILISPVYNNIKSEEIVNWILKDNLKVRFQIQLHKEIWPEEKRGV
tara:strand:- start:48639 stop:49280 length:642 start_codon:yes stop_codon:yes gene_type:complete